MIGQQRKALFCMAEVADVAAKDFSPAGTCSDPPTLLVTTVLLYRVFIYLYRWRNITTTESVGILIDPLAPLPFLRTSTFFVSSVFCQSPSVFCLLYHDQGGYGDRQSLSFNIY